MKKIYTWQVLLSGLSAGLQTKGSPVRFPVRAHAWVAGQVPSEGVWEATTQWCFSASLHSLKLKKEQEKKTYKCPISPLKVIGHQDMQNTTQQGHHPTPVRTARTEHSESDLGKDVSKDAVGQQQLSDPAGGSAGRCKDFGGLSDSFSQSQTCVSPLTHGFHP